MLVIDRKECPKADLLPNIDCSKHEYTHSEDLFLGCKHVCFIDYWITMFQLLHVSYWPKRVSQSRPSFQLWLQQVRVHTFLRFVPRIRFKQLSIIKTQTTRMHEPLHFRSREKAWNIIAAVVSLASIDRFQGVRELGRGKKKIQLYFF